MHAAAIILATLSLDGAATAPRIFRLDAGDATPISGERTDAAGTKVRSFTKAILRAGAKVRNTKGEQVVISSELLDAISASYAAMTKAGIKVPIQAGHNTDADKTRGFVTGLFRNGDALYMSCDLIGADGIALASRSDVSVYVEPSHERDGTVYPNALTHVACTPVPQVTGLGEFTPLAASLAASVFSTAPEKDDPAMWKILAAILALDVSKLDDTTGPAAVEAKVRELHTNAAAIAASLTAEKKKVETLELSVGTLTAQVNKGAPQIDAGILDEYANLHEAKLTTLVEKRIITPAQKDKLAKLFCGEKGKRPALCLSKTAAEHAGLTDAVAASVISILSEGQAGSGGNGRSQTGNQGAPPAGEGDLSAEDRKSVNDLISSYVR